MQPKTAKYTEPKSVQFNKHHILLPVYKGITGVLNTYTRIKRLKIIAFWFVL